MRCIVLHVLLQGAEMFAFFLLLCAVLELKMV